MLTGFLVLIGAAAAGTNARTYEAAILKTLGATRSRILFSFALRAALLGLAAGTVALLAGITGFYMLYVLDAWIRYTQFEYWWIHAMTAIWIVFTLILFVAEPLFLRDWFRRRFDRDPEGTLTSIARMHWLLLTVSVVTVLGAIAGAHGTSFFD